MNPRTHSLDGKVAVITGAAQGIGRAYALALAQAGARLCVSDMVAPTETVELIKAAGGTAIGLVADITDEASVNSMVKQTMETYGTLDVLVNNAALFGKLRMQPFTEISLDEWDLVMRVNVRGTWQTVKAATAAMKQSGGGSIINVSSATVFKGSPLLAHYVASKGAIVALTRSLSRELGPDNIRINAIAPGLVMTPNVQGHDDWKRAKDAIVATRALKRDSVPEDMTGVILFLASDASAFMTGQTMVVDGGVVMH
jgi:NAD(P)-dependent dehydrogenase (short-subunit alcohol dehydrogenase family)